MSYAPKPSADAISAELYWKLVLGDYEVPALKFLHSWLNSMSLEELLSFFDYAHDRNLRKKFDSSAHCAKYVSSVIRAAKEARGDYDQPLNPSCT